MAKRKSSSAWPVVIALVVLVLLVNSLNNDDDSGSGEGATDTECQTAPARAIAAIEPGLTVTGGGSLTRAHARQEGEWWYVAAEIQGPGLEESGDIGVWAMPDIEDPGRIFAAEATADEFSDWGTRSGAENAGVWHSDGANAAAACLG